MSVSAQTIKNKDSIGDWLFRLVKGVLVGIGFIIPGLSGGVLAVILGIYEPLMRFLGNLRENLSGTSCSFCRSVLAG